MSEIAKRLRTLAANGDCNNATAEQTCIDAADEIERLRNLYRDERQDHFGCDVGGYQNYGEDEWNRETERQLAEAAGGEVWLT